MVKLVADLDYFDSPDTALKFNALAISGSGMGTLHRNSLSDQELDNPHGDAADARSARVATG